jgi:hypothetical protein
MTSIIKRTLAWSVILVVAILWLPGTAVSAEDEIKELNPLPTINQLVPETEKIVKEATGNFVGMTSDGIQINDGLSPVSPGFKLPTGLKKGDFIGIGMNKNDEVVEIWKTEPETENQ